MKKVMFTVFMILIASAFSSGKGRTDPPVEEPSMGCVGTTCLGIICHEDFLDVEDAADFSEFVEDYICN